MANEKVFTYRNTGTVEEPNWEQYFIKTLADCIMMDSSGTKNIKQYVDEAIAALVANAPEALDTLKELADAITENESVVEAINTAIGNKADKSAVTYTNNTPTVQAHGGIAAGETFNAVPLTEMITRIFYPWVAPVVTAKVSAPANGGVFEKGNTQTVTSISVTVTKKSSDITKVEIFDGASSLGSKTGADLDTLNSTGSATFTFTVDVDVTANKNFQAKVTDAAEKVTTANTGSFSFVYPYYQGVIAADATADEATVKALTKLIQAKGTKAVTYTASNQKMVFATPASNGKITTITDPNGFNVTDTFTESTVSITGLDGTAQQYYVYVSNATTVSAFKITFAH